MAGRSLLNQIIGCVLVTYVCTVKNAVGQTISELQPVLILLQDNTDVRVLSVDPLFKGIGTNDRGIIVWPGGTADAWQFLGPGELWTPTRERSVVSSANLFAGSRGRGEGGDSGPDIGRLTAQVDQLPAVTVFRGKSFLTPHHGLLLNPRITIRRRVPSDDTHLPAVVAILKRGQSEIARVQFAMGQQTRSWNQMTELAAKLPNGLPAGDYSLRIEGSAESVEFTIEDEAWSAAVLRSSRELAALLPDGSNALSLQVAVETLLDQRDEQGKPTPYLSDALDVLSSTPEKELNPYLKSLRGLVLQQLTGEKNSSESTDSGLLSTGIPAIDRVRQLIAGGHWREAQDALQHVPDNPRATALAQVHQAVILSQSGLGQADAAYRLFLESVHNVQQFTDADRFLAHSSAANFLLGQSQDRLYNHSFQMAAGVRQPLLTALQLWMQAETNYQHALALAETLDAGQQAGVLVNASRLYTLLADIIRTLDPDDVNGLRKFAAAEQVAIDIAKSLATRATAADSDAVEPLILGAAAEILAHLALRDPSDGECVRNAHAALGHYLDAGSLAGVESVYRLLGLYHRGLDKNGDETSAVNSSQAAINHFLISMKLAELLRDRIPPDQFGLSHAGFFARRVYVNEQVIDLLNADGRTVEALQYAEQAKARSLRDLLAARHGDVNETETRQLEPRSLSQLLDHWPQDVVAMEYFFGVTTVWLFVVDPHGRVRVWDLSESGPQSRELVSQVKRFLAGISGYKQSMVRRLLNGDGFDHTWQDKLLAFRQILLPDEALVTLRTAKTVVVVPHHILHYFPFAALVTERDEQNRASDEMVRPQFLLDEQFDLITVPSLGVWDQLHARANRPMKQVGAIGIVDYPPLGNRSGAEDLPGVEDDLQNVAAAFGDRLQHTLSDLEATESNAQKMLARPGMLLFATHGNNVPDQPLFSHLMLHRDSIDDGLLTAEELFRQSVHSDLIVMSACYSGLADRSPMPGDDLFGIQRAFLHSGVSSVVSGLWDVYDDTGPILMRDFFRELAAGHPVAKSLAASQRRFVNQYRVPGAEKEMFVHPYFWAVYSVAGDERVCFEGRSDER